MIKKRDAIIYAMRIMDVIGNRGRTLLYSIRVILYLFLGGASAGLLFTLCLWGFMLDTGKNEHGDYRFYLAFHATKSAGYTAGLLLLALSITCLYLDLGVPDKAYLVFSRPHLTPLSVGGFSLALDFSLALLLFVGNLYLTDGLSWKTRTIAEACCLVCSFCVITYTGVLLYTQNGIPAWHSPWLVSLFVLSAMSSGISVLLLIAFFSQGSELLMRVARPIQAVHITCLILEAVSIGAYLVYIFGSQTTRASVELLMQPEIARTGLLGAVGFGVVVPLVFESYSLLTGRIRTIPLSDIACLIGCFCLRWCVVVCGAH